MAAYADMIAAQEDAAEATRNSRNALIEHAEDVFGNDPVIGEARYPDLAEMLRSNDHATRYRAATTLRALESTKKFIEANVRRRPRDLWETTTTVSLGGYLPKQILDIVRVFVPNSIAQDICDIQPLDRKVGEIFVMKARYSQAVPGVNVGDEIFKTHPTHDNYASNREVESLGTADGTVATFSKTLTKKPIYPGNAKVTAGGVTLVADRGGAFVGAGGAGTIDVVTGVMSVTFTAAPTAGNNPVVEYFHNTEVSEDIREIEMDITSWPVEAKAHKLAWRYSVEAQLSAAAHLAVDVDDTLVGLALEFLKKQRDHRLIRLIRGNAAANPLLNFDASRTDLAYSKTGYFGEIGMRVNDAETVVQSAMGRGGIDWIIAGGRAADLFRYAPGFQGTPQNAPVGPHKIGTMRDGTVAIVKVPDANVMPTNEVIYGYKGYMLGDASVIMAEWVPLYFSPTFESPTLVNRQGAMSLYDTYVGERGYLNRGTVTF